MGKPTLTSKRLHELLHYDPSTKQFTYRIDHGTKRTGDVAGTITSTGLHRIQIDGRPYSARRLAIFYETGRWPSTPAKSPKSTYKRKSESTLTKERVLEIYDWNPQTREFTYRFKRGHMEAGSIAGNSSLPEDRRRIGIDGCQYLQSHLVFFLTHGYLPSRGQEVDHIDCDPTNDSPKNLRLATSSQSKANRRGNKGKSLPKGAYFWKRDNNYKAQIQVDGKQIHLGYFDTPEEAHAAYVKAAKKYFGKFARAK